MAASENEGLREAGYYILAKPTAELPLQSSSLELTHNHSPNRFGLFFTSGSLAQTVSVLSWCHSLPMRSWRPRNQPSSLSRPTNCTAAPTRSPHQPAACHQLEPQLPSRRRSLDRFPQEGRQKEHLGCRLEDRNATSIVTQGSSQVGIL